MSVVLTFAVIFELFLFIPDTVIAATKHTADEAIAWCKSKEGKKIEDADSNYMYQCVDFVRKYYRYLGVSPVSGSGYEYATNELPSGWKRIKGGKPQKGDILVYGCSGSNDYGHVGIYESSQYSWHQNYHGVYVTNTRGETYMQGTGIEQISGNYKKIRSNYWGVIRPNFKAATPPTLSIIDKCFSGNEMNFSMSLGKSYAVEKAGIYFGTNKDDISACNESMSSIFPGDSRHKRFYYNTSTPKKKSLSGTIKNLTAGTTYYYKLHVKIYGTWYNSSVESFKTLEADSSVDDDSIVKNSDTVNIEDDEDDKEDDAIAEKTDDTKTDKTSDSDNTSSNPNNNKSSADQSQNTSDSATDNKQKDNGTGSNTDTGKKNNDESDTDTTAGNNGNTGSTTDNSSNSGNTTDTNVENGNNNGGDTDSIDYSGNNTGNTDSYDSNVDSTDNNVDTGDKNGNTNDTETGSGYSDIWGDSSDTNGEMQEPDDVSSTESYDVIMTGVSYNLLSAKYPEKAVNVYLWDINNIKNGTTVNLYDYLGTTDPTQTYTFSKNSAGNYLMVPFGTKYTVNVSAVKSGANIITWQNKKANNEYFIIKPTGNGTYKLALENDPTLFLTATSNSSLSLKKETSDSSQEFVFIKQ